ncbi:MAG: PTS sugar transporter subunit IIA [Planctomycetota bacterium]|nr:PTS sugar transporter subunit IIA [Planctomycetota bacterium]
MPHDFISLEELAVQLGRDRREVEKLVQRGRIPGHRIDGTWRFHPAEIRHWLEQEMREYSPEELAGVESAQRALSPTTESPVTTLLAPETVCVPLEARTKRSVLESLIEVAGRTWQIWEPAAVLEACIERENAMSTAFDFGIAIPHPRNPLPQALGSSIIAFGRTLSGIPFGGAKRSLTDMFFLVLCRDSRTHLAVLARLGRLLQVEGFVDDLRAAETSLDAYDLICAADQKLEDE